MLDLQHPLSLAVQDASNHQYNSDLQRCFLKEFSGSHHATPIYLIGKNSESEQVLKSGLPVTGLINDQAGPSEFWHRLPQLPMGSVPKDSWVVNCSTSIAPVQVMHALDRHGLRCLSYSDLQALSPALGQNLPAPWFVQDQISDWEHHFEDWLRLFDRLEDAESKQTLVDILSFRLTGRPELMHRYSVRLQDQYMESFMGYSQETFVDAGGFDGDTSEIFLNRYPDCREVHLFEPSTANLKKAEKRLARYNQPVEKIRFYEFGLSDKAATLHFDAESGSACAVGEQGGTAIQVEALDELTHIEPSFIKMDLEGWELHALKGCQKTLQRHRPKLAIAVYHRASDFWRIPEFVLSCQPDYRLRLRHYTEGWSETVMYFLPGNATQGASQ